MAGRRAWVYDQGTVRGVPLRALLPLLSLCLACQPSLPPKDDSADTEDPVDSEPPLPETDDTEPPEPEGPCALPESEPNDGEAEADELPTEVRGCGAFQAATDADHWAFTFTDDAWVGLDVDAWSLGSPADVSLLLTSDALGVGMAIPGWMDQPDVHLRFPAPPGAWRAVIRQAVGGPIQAGAGEDWRYTVRATSTKPPIDAERDESGGTEVVLVPGDSTVAFGRFDADGDTDVWTITVPAGRHRVVVDVEAHALGAPSNVALRLRNGAGTLLGLVTDGELGWEPDAWSEQFFTAADTLSVEVIEEGGRGGVGWWYALRIGLEAR